MQTSEQMREPERRIRLKLKSTRTIAARLRSALCRLINSHTKARQMKLNTLAIAFISVMLAAVYTLAIADDKAEKAKAKVINATDIVKEWQPPNTSDSHVLGGGDRIAYMRLSVKSPLKDVWQFYAQKIGYSGNTDFSEKTGSELDPKYIIISDQTRNIILLIHSTAEYTVTVRIPKHDGKVTNDILVTIGRQG